MDVKKRFIEHKNANRVALRLAGCKCKNQTIDHDAMRNHGRLICPKCGVECLKRP